MDEGVLAATGDCTGGRVVVVEEVSMLATDVMLGFGP